MGLFEAIGKRVLIRRLERIRKELEGDKPMKTSPGVKVAAVAVILLVLHAVITATQKYFEIDLTPTWAEWSRAALSAGIGAFLYWLRSPKDQPPIEPEGDQP